MKRIAIVVSLIASSVYGFTPDPYYDDVNSQCVNGVLETNRNYCVTVHCPVSKKDALKADENKCSNDFRKANRKEIEKNQRRAVLFGSLGDAFHGALIPQGNMYSIQGY